MSWKKVAIGIDLGTTKCCVGVVRDGKVEILENERSSKTTPSYVAFTDTERLIGEDAKDQATLNPTNTVFGVKRLLGRQFDDPAVQEQVPRRLPFVVGENERRKPCIGVTYKTEPRTLFPEQVTAMLLTKMRKIAQTQLNCFVNDKMKELAQDRLGCSIEDAVISVPASFSNAQRQATMDAATIAGLKVLALINEPTAAAIAYHANRKVEDDETIAVVDFGGGKLEVSIVLVNKSAVEVKAVFGCPDFGGSDIDNLIIELLIIKFRGRTGIDLSSIIKARERLRGSCESLKHTLSLLPEARVQLDCLSADTDFNETITRKEFEESVGPKTRKSLDQVYHELSFYVKEHGLVLRKVLLVGGSTRIPLVQRWLEERFGSTKLDKTVNPDEAVAQGAAVWAAMLGGDNTVTDLRMGDVLGRAIVMEQEGKQHVLYDQFAPVPAKKKLSIRSWHRNTDLKLFETKSITADDPFQTLAIYQCEWRLASLKFEFFVNSSGICSVSEMSNGDERELNTLIFETLRLFQKSDMANMIEDEELFERDTLNEQMRIAALSELESHCFKQKNRLESLLRCKNISESTFSDLSQRVEDMIAWIDSCPSESESLYNQKKLELEAQCDENLPKDDTAFLRRPSSKRSSSANVPAQTESYDISGDGKGVPTDRKARRDQTNGDDSEQRQRRFVSHSSQRSGRKRGESPARVDKSIGTSDRESRQGKNGDKRTISLPRRDGSGSLRAKPASREQTAAASHKANEVSVRNHSSDRKLREEALTGPKDRNQLVEYEEQRHDGVQRSDVGPPKMKPPLVPSVRHSTTDTNRSPPDQPGEDVGPPKIKPPLLQSVRHSTTDTNRPPPDQPGEDHGTHVISSHGNGITQSSDRTEVTSNLVCLKTEEDSVITRNRIRSSSNEFTARSSSRLDHGKPSSHSREKAESGARSTPVIKEEVMISSSPQAEDSVSKQSASLKTSYSTERASCDDDADICYGYSFERPQYETRSISVQTESCDEAGQSLTVEAKPGPREILMVAAGKKSETGDICDECHVQKSCGCTIAASLASSNKIRSTPHFSINGVGTSNSRYDPTKYATPLTTVASRDSLQKTPSSSTHGVQYSNGTYTAALTSTVSRSVAPLAIAQDDSRCRVTSTISSLTEFSSVVDRPYTLNLIKANENCDLRGLTEAVGEIRAGAGHDYKVKSAMLSRADTGLESDSTIGSRPDPTMRADRPWTTSSSIRTRSKSRAEALFAEAYSLNIDPDCVCGSGKVHCSDCRSARHMRKDTIGNASSVPSSSVLVREAMTATSSGSNLDSIYVRKWNNDTLLDELMNHKCQCGSGKSTCANCISKYLLERPATSSGGANTRHLNPPGHSLSVPYSDDSSSMRSYGSSKRTQAVYMPRESSPQTSISFHCICYKKRTDGCMDCYLDRSMQRQRLNDY